MNAGLTGTPPDRHLFCLFNHATALARRRRSRAIGEAYARDMVAGHWPFTGDAIRFDIDSNLIDGQHRIKAIIESGVTLPFVLVFGLDPKTKHALDMGRKRSAADVLALKGYTQSTRLQGAARQLLLIKHNSYSARITTAEIEDIVERHPKLAECTHHFNNTRDISPSLLTALYYILAHLLEEPDHATDLLNAMRYHYAKSQGALARGWVGCWRSGLQRFSFKAGVPA